MTGRRLFFVLISLFFVLSLTQSLDVFSAPKKKQKKSAVSSKAKKPTPTPTPSPTPTEDEEDNAPTPTPAPTAAPSPYVDQWTGVIDIGFNFPPMVDQSYQAASMNYATKKHATALPSFGFEMLYRATDYTRFSVGLGAGTIRVQDEPTNFYFRLTARPDIVVDIKGLPSFYLGPIVGVYFISQQEETGSAPSGETYRVNAGTDLAIGVGGQIGSDFTLGKSTRIGTYIRYVIVDGAEFDGERLTPSTFTMRAPYKVRFLTIGTRFLFDL